MQKFNILPGLEPKPKQELPKEETSNAVKARTIVKTYVFDEEWLTVYNFFARNEITKTKASNMLGMATKTFEQLVERYHNETMWERE